MGDFLTRRTKELGIQMSEREIAEATTTMRLDENGKFTKAVYKSWLAKRTHPAVERIALVSTLSEHQLDGPVEMVNQVLSTVGTVMYASLAAIYAGEAGMNIVGCCFVGCIGGFGGGTLNNLIVGNTPVFWIKQPHILLLTIGAGIVTFFSWPIIEEQRVASEVARMEPDLQTGLVGFDGFERWLADGGEFANRLRRRCERKLGLRQREATARQVFESVDPEGRGFLRQKEVRNFLRRASIDSPLLFAVDSACLSTFAVFGARNAIARGLPPSACCAAGVIGCFGGLLRDLICRRDVALGAESFALAMGAGSSVYVGLRQLMLRGWPLPLGLRTTLAAATVLGFRCAEWFAPTPLLSTMFDMPINPPLPCFANAAVPMSTPFSK